MEITPYTRMVFYHETDRMDIVNHSNYIHMAEEARVDFMEKSWNDRSILSSINSNLNCLHNTRISADYKSILFPWTIIKNIYAKSSLFYINYILLQETFLIRKM